MSKLSTLSLGRRGAIAAVAIVGGVALMLLSPRPAGAAGSSAGAATLFVGDGSVPLTAGGSHTPFLVNLPPQAHCTGDTAHGGFNVYSYIVPVAISPGSLTFDSSNGPNNNAAAHPLVDTSGSPYNAATTAPTTGAIYPGSPPTFDFAIFDTTSLPAGDYNLGIECATSTGDGDVFFNAVITVTSKTSDPNGFVFSVAGTATTTTTSSTVAGSTTSTLGGTTTSTSGGSATSTTSTTTGTSGSTTSTSMSTPTGDPTTTTNNAVAVGQSASLATTGSSSMTLYDWGVTLVLAGLVLFVSAERWSRRDW